MTATFLNFFTLQRAIVVWVITAMVVNPASAQTSLPTLAQQQLTLQQQREVIYATANNIQVDLAADQARQAELKQASNGTQVINIATPTKGGVSHNQFTEFSVGQDGVILNNSAAPVLTQLGGWSDGNRRLAGGEAAIILNEVTGSGRSQLGGYLEVAGKSAEFVLANANGISCSGCGFINTPRVTLVTGTPDMADGALKGFAISNGDFSLDGTGLDAANVDRFDILTRAATINAKLYADQLAVYTGNNYFDYNQGELTARGSALAPAFEVALDVSSLGGMYANSIRLIGTERGMGVNSQGLIQSVTDLEISADGDIQLKGAQANRTASITSHSGDITNTGTLYAQAINLSAGQYIRNERVLAADKSIALSGDNFSQQGSLYAGLSADGQWLGDGNLKVDIAGDMTNVGQVYVRGALNLSAGSLHNDQGNMVFEADSTVRLTNGLTNTGLLQFNRADLDITQGQWINRGGVLLAQSIKGRFGSIDNHTGFIVANGAGNDELALDLSLAGTFDNRLGTVFAKGNSHIGADNILNNQGSIALSGNTQLALNLSGHVDNTGGNVQADSVVLSASHLDNKQGQILAGTMALDVRDVSNDLGRLQAGTLSLTSDNYRSQGGVLLALDTTGQALTLEVGTELANTGNAIIESRSGDITLKTTALDNTGGRINLASHGQLNLTAETLDNQSGQLVTEGSLQVDAHHLANNQGYIQGAQLAIHATNIENHAGTLVATGSSLSLVSVEAIDNRDGLVQSRGTLALDAAGFDNTRGVIVGERLQLALDHFTNIDGLLQGREIDLELPDFDNTGGTLYATAAYGQGLSLKTSGTFDNRSGTLLSAADLNLDSLEVDNRAGQLVAGARMDIRRAAFNNEAGLVQSGSALSLELASFNNRKGALILGDDAGSELTIAGDFNNQGGEVFYRGGQELAISAAGFDNSDEGFVGGTGDVRLNADYLDNRDGILLGDGDINLTITSFNNDQGVVESRNLAITTDQLNNAGTLVARASGSNALILTTGQLTNSGLIESYGTDLILENLGLDNQGGTIFHRGAGELLIRQGSLINSGTILGASGIRVEAGSVDNTDGLLQAGGVLALDADKLENNGEGVIQAVGNQVLSIRTSQLTNSGVIAADHQLQLTADELANTHAGVIQGVAQLDIVAVSLQNAGWMGAGQLTVDASTLTNQGNLHAGNLSGVGSNWVNTGLVWMTDTAATSQLQLTSLINSGTFEFHNASVVTKVQDLDNRSGEWLHQGGESLIQAGTLDNRSGTLAIDHLTLVADSIDNRAGELLADKLTATLGAFDNRKGLVATTDGDLQLDITDTLLNSEGLIQGGGETTRISATGIDNNQGQIIHAGAGLLSLAGETLDNRGQGDIYSKGNLALVIAGNLENDNANIQAVGRAGIVADAIVNRGGMLLAGEHLSITADSLTNENQGADIIGLLSSDWLTLTVRNLVNRSDARLEARYMQLSGEHFDNQGLVLATGTDDESLVLALDRLDNSGYIESAGTQLQLVDTHLTNSGNLIHRGTGSIVMDNGHLINRGLIESSGALNLNLASINNQDGTLVARAPAGIALTTGELNNTRGLITAGNIVLDATDIINTHGEMSGDNLTIRTDSLSNAGGLVAAQALMVDAGTFDNTSVGGLNGVVDAVTLTLGAEYLNNHALIQAEHIDLSGKTFNNGQGMLVAGHSSHIAFSGGITNSFGQIESQGESLVIDGSLDNRDGVVLLSGTGVLQLADVENTRGELLSNGSLTIASNSLVTNSDGLIQAVADINIAGAALDNATGILVAGQRLGIEVNALDNREGLLVARSTGDDALTLRVDEPIDNRLGTIETNGFNFSLAAPSIINTGGEIRHWGDGTFAITSVGDFANVDGLLFSKSTLALDIAGNFVNQGKLVAQGRLTIASEQMTNDADSLLDATRVEITAGQINNRGRIQGEQLHFSGATLDNRAGELLALGTGDNTLQFSLTHVDNRAGGLIESHGHNQVLNAHIDNRGGELLNLGLGTLVLTDLLNSDGTVYAAGNLQVEQADLVNENGRLEAAHNLSMAVDLLDNRAGFIFAGDNLSASGTDWNNSLGGYISAGKGFDLGISGELDNRSGYLVGLGQDMNLHALGIDNTLGHIAHEGEGTLLVDAVDGFNNRGGNLSGRGSLNLKAGSLFNQAEGDEQGLITADRVSLTAAQLHNNGGHIQGDSQLLLTVPLLNNSGGKILSLGSASDALILNADYFNNQGGLLQAYSQDLDFSDVALDNRSGTINHQGTGLFRILSTSDLQNDKGTIQSNGNILLALAGLDNQGGLIRGATLDITASNTIDNSAAGALAGDTLRLAAAHINNHQGLLAATGNTAAALVFETLNVIDNREGVIRNTAENWNLTLDNIDNTGGVVVHHGTGTFTLSSDKLLTNTGMIASTANLQLNLAGLDNYGSLVADNNLLLTSTGLVSNRELGLIKAGNALTANGTGSLGNQGEILGVNQLNLTLDGTLNNSGSIITDATNGLISASVINNAGILAHNGAGTFTITADTIRNNSAGSIKTTSTLALNGTVIDNHHIISAINLQVADFTNLTNHATGHIEADSVVFTGNKLTDSKLTNNGTLINSGSTLDLFVSNLINNGSLFTSSVNQSFHGELINSGQLVHAGNGVLNLGDAGSVTINTGGSIATAGTAELNGSMSGTGTLFAKSGIEIGTKGTFSNTGSQIFTEGDVAVYSALNNSGRLIADGKLTVDTTGDINNTNGLLQGQQLDIKAGVITNENGEIMSTGAGSGSIVASSIDNTNKGKILSTNDSFYVSAINGIDNTSGRIAKDGNGLLHLSTDGPLRNIDGLIETGGRLKMNTGTVYNQSGGITGGSLELNVSDLISPNGALIATSTEDSVINARFIVNQNGDIKANSNNFSINTTGMFQNLGDISHYGLGDLTFNTGTFYNGSTGLDSKIQSNGNIVIDTLPGVGLTNYGEISASGLLDIDVDVFNNSGILGSRQGIVDINTGGFTLYNREGGQISGAQKVNITTGTLSNKGLIQSDDTVALALPNWLDNELGNISAANLLDIHIASAITFTQGETLATTGNLKLTSDYFINNSGNISAGQELTLIAASLSNYGNITGGTGVSHINLGVGPVFNAGRISSQDELHLTSDYLGNYGSIAAGENLIVNAGKLINSTNRAIYSGGDMSLTVDILDNYGGTVFSQGNMLINATGNIENFVGRIESLGTMGLSANIISNKRFDPEETVSPTVREEHVLGVLGPPICAMQYVCMEYGFTESTVHTFSISGNDAIIASTGNMALHGSSQIINSYGTISTGGNLSLSGGDLILDSVVPYTVTRSGSVYYGFGISGTETNIVTTTAINPGTTPFGIFRVAGNIYGELSGEVNFTVNGHLQGEGEGNTDILSAVQSTANRGSNAALAASSINEVIAHTGQDKKTNGAGLSYNSAEDGSDLGAEGLGGGGLGHAGGIGSRSVTGVFEDAGSYNPTTGAVSSVGSSDYAIHAADGSIVTSVAHAIVDGVGGAGRSNSLGEAALADIDALQKKALETLLGESAATDAVGNAINLEGSASNQPMLDGLHANEVVVPDASVATDLTGALATAVSQTFTPPTVTRIDLFSLEINLNNLGGLFVHNPAPDSNVLIETRPEFTEYSRFLGSDYLLDALGYDPDKTQKRLGDAFYENQLVRDALMRTANTRYIDGVSDDYSQMQLLMDNAVRASQSLQLTIGVELTDEQCAALTQDILWLVPRRVNGETVLVPYLYLTSLSAEKLAGSDAVMAAGGNINLTAVQGVSTQGKITGNNLQFTTLGNLQQGGNLLARGDIGLLAQGNLNNAGQLQGQQVNLFAQGNLTNTATGSISGNQIRAGASESITNQNQITASSLLALTAGDGITNTAGSTLQSGGWLNLTAQNDIRNQQGLIEGVDVSLVSREGSIINRTEYDTATSTNGRNTSTRVGAASTIISHNSLAMDAGKDLELQGSQLKAAQDITLRAGNDIKLEAITEINSRETNKRGVITKTSETTHQVVSIEAGHHLTLDAGRDLNAQGTQFKAGGDASLSAGRDLNLTAVADTSHNESIAKRKKTIDTTTTHTLVDIQSGGNTRLTAGQDANLTGINVNAEGNVSLAATRDVNLTAVVDSDYHYDYTKKKKSFGRSKTTENETLTQTVTGGVINAGGNILVNAVEQQNGSVALLESRNVNIAGAVLTAGGNALIGAKGDVTLTAVAEDSIDYHRKSKSGLGGLTGKSKSETHLRTNQIGSLVGADGDAVIMAGKDVNLEASTVYAGQSAELHAGLIDDSGDINITSLQNLSFDETKTRKKSFGLDVGKDFVSFSKETRTGNDKTLVTNAGSQIIATDNITGNASRDITLQGSLLDAGNNVNLNAGRNINLLAGTDSYSEGQEQSTRRDGIGFSGDDNGFSVFAGNETRKNRTQTGENLAAATQINAGNNVNLTAEQDILIAGSDVNAGKSITLDAKRDVVITTSTDTLATQERNSFTRDGLTLTANHNIGQAVDAIKNLGKGDNAVSDASGVMRAADAMNNVGPSGSAFLGQTTTTDTYQSDTANARGSYLNAGEDVTIIAGNNATVAGSQVNAQRNISIDANDINLIAAENSQSTTTKTDYQQVGVTLQATQGNASLTAGFSKADSKLVVKDIATSGTGLNAGQDVSLIARNDINIVGSDVNAKRDITLDAGNDVNITSGQGYTTSQFESDYQSAGAGINFGTNGIGFTAYVALGENELDRENIHNTNSQLMAGKSLSITSGNDTTIKGGNLQGQDISLDVGNNLTIASVQDTGSVKGKQWDVSGSITVGAGVSGGASVGYGETEGSSAWVAEQTSLIGSNSVTIKTGNHTQIDGALVANIKEDGTDGGNLSLDTRTLGFTDIKDHHEETSTYLSVGFSTGGNPGANSNTGASPDSKGNSYSFDAQYSDLDRKQTTRATLGNGTVTVREDQVTGNDSLAGLNRNIDDAQEITKDKSTNIDVYYSSTAVESLGNLTKTDDSNTLVVWKDNLTSVASPDAWKVVGENGTQSLQDTGTAISVVTNKDNLGAGDFWKTLDNTVKGTQVKNDLLRDPANRHILEGLQSKDGDEYAAAMTELGQLAQAKFGVSLSDIALYDAGKTTSGSLGDTLLTDVRGGMVLEGNQQGNIYVDAGDGKTKTDMVNTLGHEVYENQTFQTNGVNDNKQEDLANAFGEHFSNRINQASGGTLNSTGGNDFNSSLQNSNAIKYGTARANDVGNAAVDHRQLASAEVQAIRENASAFASRQGYRNSDGSLDTTRAERELTQAFLSEADAAWDKSYQEQGVVINQNATVFIDQLREQYADTPFADGGKAFVVNEGDREDRLKYAGTLSTQDGFSFYRDNAATDAGKNLLGQKEGININPEFNSGLSQGYKDQDIVTGQERAEFWENPVSNSLALLGSGVNQLIFPADGMKASLDKDMKSDALYRLEVLEGDAYGAGYVHGREFSESNDSANQAIFGVLAAGRVLSANADKTPEVGAKNVDELLPNTNTKVLTEREARRLDGDNQGLIYVTESPKGKEAAQEFQSGTTGAFSDLESGKNAVPALRYDNPNEKGINYVKFDGIEKGADGSTILLIDAKTKLPLWNESAKNDVLSTLGRVDAALQQNPGYKVVYEFPNNTAANAASLFIKDTPYENTVTIRVRKK